MHTQRTGTMKDYTDEDSTFGAAYADGLEDSSGRSSRRTKRKIKIEMRKGPSPMTTFFQQVDSIQSDIDTLNEATANINKLREDFIHAMTVDDEIVITKKIKVVVETNNKRAKQVKNSICSLEQETKKLQAKKGKLTEGDQRIRNNLCSTLTRKYRDELLRYQAAQEHFKADKVSKIKRQAQIVKPNITDDEVLTILRTERGRDDLYKELVLAGGVSSEVKNIYYNVNGRYQDVLALESSVAELHQMMLDMALLVEQQGEMLDQIEYHVKSAGDNVEDGNVHLHKALRYLKKIQKKRLMVCFIMVVIIVVAASFIIVAIMT